MHSPTDHGFVEIRPWRGREAVTVYAEMGDDGPVRPFAEYNGSGTVIEEEGVRTRRRADGRRYSTIPVSVHVSHERQELVLRPVPDSWDATVGE